MLIKLNELGRTDLNKVWVRSMGGNRLRHYKASITAIILDKKPLEEIKTLIEKEGIENVELQVVPNSVGFNGTMQIEDVSNIVFKDGNYRELKKVLKKVNTKYLIHQVTKLSIPKRMFNVLAKVLNKVGFSLETFYTESFCTPVDFLSVAFEESQIEQAIQALFGNLEVLRQKNLIMGHFVMPSMLQLADDRVGAGEKYFALVCFPIRSRKGMVEQFGEDERRWPLDLGKSLGLQYMGSEGSVNYLDGKKFEDKWDIETVDLFDKYSDDAYDQYVQSYKDSVEAINKEAKRFKKELNETVD